MNTPVASLPAKWRKTARDERVDDAGELIAVTLDNCADELEAALADVFVDPTDPGHDVGVLREHVRHLERRICELHGASPALSVEPTCHAREIAALRKLFPNASTSELVDAIFAVKNAFSKDQS